MATTGTGTIDFGAFPGAADADLVITGQAAIVAGSYVEAWIRPVATSDHTVGEHVTETIRVIAHSIVAGTGFTITAINTSQLAEPLESMGAGQRDVALLAGRTIGSAAPNRGGAGTLIYGTWTVAWVWV